ncbi:MAG: hypothetical protein N4A57_09875 [Anaeromicrobium sp.]|uniref:hypothetical protein n=1 Tax=Anaeromicrobium sp. TaxID=1929132 RepID=UPI0025EB12F9|nr:hypothetical protein [Anaeromicrobium sp.]MCT4594557.1 hypothetical protein [Anaeromicrobium sp.]
MSEETTKGLLTQLGFEDNSALLFFFLLLIILFCAPYFGSFFDGGFGDFCLEDGSTLLFFFLLLVILFCSESLF